MRMCMSTLSLWENAPTRTDSVSESRCVMTILTIECDRELPAFMRVAATGWVDGGMDGWMDRGSDEGLEQLQE